MITKIDIPSFGLYNNYSWNHAIGGAESFKRMNIIYGRNYSGKTTLSRIFKSVEDGALHRDYESGSFSIKFMDGKTVTGEDLATNFKIRVYNSDFVKENLSWLHNVDGTIKPFTILGAKNVVLDRKIKEVEVELGSVEKKSGLLYLLSEKEADCEKMRVRHQAKVNELEDKLRKKANDKIKIDSNLFVATTSKRNYTITDIKADIVTLGKNLAVFALSGGLADSLKNLLKEVALNDIGLLPESSPNFSKYYERTKFILGRKIRPSAPILDLVNDNLLQEWVRQGIDRHKGKRENCGFCGNPIGEELWERLDAHFSKESQELRVEIGREVESLRKAKQALSGFVKLTRNNFYSSLSIKFDSAMEVWIEKMNAYEQNIDELIRELYEREGDIFKDRQLREIPDVSGSILDAIRNFNSLIIEHNAKTKSLAADQAAARTKLRRAEIAGFLTDISYFDALSEIEKFEMEYEDAKKELPGLAGQVSVLEDEKNTLKAQAKDESKGAELVNQHLSHFFGHNELRLVTEGEKSSVRFKIQRNAVDANNLSEGECSLISFCYFVARLEDELKDPTGSRKLIVYIDDPISSLDSNHIFFMFSLIESVIARPNQYGQLFISTHNLDFLKYLRRLTSKKSELRHFIIVRKNKGITDLLLAPEYLEKYITEFNFLFKQIYFCSLTDDATISHDYLYNFGNNMRKFLEAYLFYRYPTHKWELADRIRKFFGDDSVSAILINRVVNEYSHIGEQFERGMEPIDVDEVRKIAKLVIDKIKAADPDQFDALVNSITDI